MVAASHLVGTGGFRNIFLKSGGTIIPEDGNGTKATDYLQEFADYDLTDTTGVDAGIIPAGFATYFVDHLENDNTFNKHGDAGHPIQAGTGNDKFFWLGGDDKFFGGSGGRRFFGWWGRHRYFGL